MHAYMCACHDTNETKHIVKNMNKPRISALEKLLKPKSTPEKALEENKTK